MEQLWMDYEYSFKKILSKDLVILSSIYGTQTWKMVKLRQNTICRETFLKLPKDMIAFRPITNKNNRTHRISMIGMIRIIKAGKQNEESS